MDSVYHAIGPGPGAYGLPTLVGYEKHDVRKPRFPQYSFGIRKPVKSRACGPGAGAYMVSDFTRYGTKYSPAYSFGKKILEPISFSPGPGTYNTHNAPIFKGARPPAYSMTSRPRPLKATLITPGADQYAFDLNFVKRKFPAYSLAARYPIQKAKVVSPGPAAYKETPACTVYRCPPAYSMQPFRSAFKNQGIPGPNQYNLQSHLPGRKGPQFSFGVKHSPFAPPFIIPCDN